MNIDMTWELLDSLIILYEQETQLIFDPVCFNAWLELRFNCTYYLSLNIIQFNSEEDYVQFSLSMS